jgi:hypothetical protein
MDREKIVQFIGFVTNLKYDEFSVPWEFFCKQIKKDQGTNTLERAIEKNNFKYRYISHHRCNSIDFRFSFMKGRQSEHFPEHSAKVVQLGGYKQVDIYSKEPVRKPELKVLVFLTHDETDLHFFRLMPFNHLNTYEAYYENCCYGHILEFFVNSGDEAAIINHVKLKNKIEIAVFQESSALVV